jgi:hypothetical protein
MCWVKPDVIEMTYAKAKLRSAVGHVDPIELMWLATREQEMFVFARGSLLRMTM